MPVPPEVVDNQPKLITDPSEPYTLLKVWYRIYETAEKYCILYVYEWNNSWPWWDFTGYTQHPWDYEPIIYCRDKTSGVVTWIYDAGHYDADNTTDTSTFDVTSGSHQYSPNTSGATGTIQPASSFAELDFQTLLAWERRLIKVARYGTGQLSLLEAWFDPCKVKETDAFTTPWETGQHLDETATYTFSSCISMIYAGPNFWYNIHRIRNRTGTPITSLKFCFDGTPDVDDVVILTPNRSRWKWRIEGNCLIVELEVGYASSQGVKEGEELRFAIESNSWADLGVADLAVDRGNAHTYDDDEPNIRVMAPVAALREEPLDGLLEPDLAVAVSFGDVLGPDVARVFPGVMNRREPLGIEALLDADVFAEGFADLAAKPVESVRGIGESRAKALQALFAVETVGDLARIPRHPLVQLGRAVRHLRALEQNGLHVANSVDRPRGDAQGFVFKPGEDGGQIGSA